MLKIHRNLKFKKYLFIASGILACFYFAGAIFLNEIESHNVEILEKSPLFPANDYEYMTTEETFYSIDGVVIEIPAYFRTDFASIPKALWFIDAPYKAKFVYPAIWHDYMYSCNSNKSRKQIDDIFFWLLRYEQNSLFSSFKMYLAVRMFGGFYYNKASICNDVNQQQEQNKIQYDKENVNHG
jgi:hypothetical protein